MSDDNEFARYLASYLADNCEEYVSVSKEDGDFLIEIEQDILRDLIKHFRQSLP